MRLALEQATAAAADDEVPVGAVLVSASGEVLAAARNATERSADPTAHAELLCIRSAATAVGGWRLLDATLYVTLEPCPMCAGALLQARVGTVVYGARNPLLGADGSWISMLPRAADAGGAACCAGSEGAEQPAGDAEALPAGGASLPAAPAAPAAPARPHPFHPNLVVRRGVLAEECGALMKAFFARRRAEAAAAKSGSGSGSGSEPR
ncbi:tRNA(adenine(34)) chloroplastic [Micractinium conductrix]|uniref:tRNA(adenine(34)) deaminase n=1 Tax=Micractinium conductrix TaxID=554055 RepID=A0A2P6VSE6_9CHLO|nr:tRNA(adenine(34)) chloroplastic [Micractinium conductrix]|eukprot:PSC77002.1 tRNA(adenine(34)) chloroplastic [Micractinium conductrix]